MMTMLVRIVLQKLDDNKFIGQLTEWEFYISESERVTTERLPELLMKPLLFATTGGAMYRYLCMHLDDVTTYQTTMIIVSCCHASSMAVSLRQHSLAGSRGAGPGGEPMESKGGERRRITLPRWRQCQWQSGPEVLQHQEDRTLFQRLTTSARPQSSRHVALRRLPARLGVRRRLRRRAGQFGLQRQVLRLRLVGR